MLPEWLVPLHIPVAAEDVVDEDVEPAPLALNVCDQLGNRCGILVVHHARRAVAPGSRDQLAGVVDRLGPADLRRPGTPTATAGRVDEESRASELDRDRPTCTASRACDECHARCLGHSKLTSSTPETSSIACASVLSPERPGALVRLGGAHAIS